MAGVSINEIKPKSNAAAGAAPGRPVLRFFSQPGRSLNEWLAQSGDNGQ
jgi:hypothetical protein